MKLVIAEKPSVDQSLARVVGATKRQDGYLEGNGYLVSWCVGHLVELSAPERYDERFAKWRLEDLPILPERELNQLMKKRDELRNKELLQAIEQSRRSFEEIIDFLGTDDSQN